MAPVRGTPDAPPGVAGAGPAGYPGRAGQVSIRILLSPVPAPLPRRRYKAPPMSVLISLLPDFILIVLGRLLKKGVAEAAWVGIDRLNYMILFPSLIFISALGRQPAAADLLTIGLGVWSIILLGMGLAWLVRPLGPERFLDFAGTWQTAWRFNTALGFVAIQALPEGARALLSIAIGLAVPLANILAVSALSRGQAMSLSRTLVQVVTNPFLLASVGGMTLSILDVTLPHLVRAPLEHLAVSALPIALLSIGAALDWRALMRLDPFMLAINAIKLLILPGAAYLVTWAIGLSPLHASVLVVFAALPTASASHVLASVFGADRQIVATLIAQTTMIGCFTLPLWLMLVT